MSTTANSALVEAGYELGAVVRRPGLGAVHEARGPEGQPVWVWLLPHGGAVSAERFADQARALAEARKAAEARGRGLPRMLGWGDAPEGLYLASEPVAGVSFEDLVARGEEPAPARVVRLLGEAADALDAAHRAGILHRMLRPAALLVQEPPLERCHLVDFALGLDRGFFRPDPDGLAYASPEELRDRPATPASDRYSFACVAFEALTGMPPFPAESAEQLREAHLSSPPPRATAARPDLPAAVDDAFETALSKNPSTRPATAADLVAALARALLSERPAGAAAAAPARPPAPADRAASPAPAGRRRPLRRTLEIFGLVRPHATPPATATSNGADPATARPRHEKAPGSARRTAAEKKEPKPARKTRQPRPASPPSPSKPPSSAAASNTAAAAGPAKPAARAARGRRGAWGRRAVVVVGGVALLAGAGLGGWLVGQRGGGDSARAGVDSAAVRVDLPAGWERVSSAPAVPGLELSGPVAARRGGSAMVAGIVPAVVFPERVGRAVDGSATDPETVRAGRIELYRWRGLRAGDRRVTLFATPSSEGLAVLACMGPDAGRCERAAGSLGVPGSEPASLDELAFYGTQVAQVLERMDARRAGGAAALRDAGSRTGQARVARSLAGAHRGAARALRDLAVPAVAVDAHPELLAALRGVAGGYERLAAAIRRGDRGAYRRAARLVERRERQLGRVVEGL